MIPGKRPGRPPKGSIIEVRILYKNYKCMSCGTFRRTPIYGTSINTRDGFSSFKRKESDPCQRCGSRTVL